MDQTNETTNAAFDHGMRAVTGTKMRVKKTAFIGLMGAVSAVLMLFRFPLPFMPPFMSFDLSGLMEMLGGFMFGPGAALMIIVVRYCCSLSCRAAFLWEPASCRILS